VSPAWVAVAMTGGIAFLGSVACLPWDLFKIDGSRPLPFESHVSPLCGRSLLDELYRYSNKWPRMVLGFHTDMEQMLEENWGISMLPAYALHPPLVAYLFPDAWKSSPSAATAMAAAAAADGDKQRSWLRSWIARLRQPSSYRPLLGLAYLLGYHALINVHEGVYSKVVQHVVLARSFMLVFTAMQLGLFAALWHVLPNRATPLSALGTCALSTYIVYLGPIENFAMMRSQMGASLRFVNDRYHPYVEVTELLILALILYVATAFSVGATQPMLLPRWLAGAKLPLGGYTLPDAARLPKLHFPCGAHTVALAWLVIIAIPNVLPLPTMLPPSLPSQSWMREEERGGRVAWGRE
jgi:hypothetical protein